MATNNNRALSRRNDSSLVKFRGGSLSTITPVTDIYETDEAFILKLDMPGVTREAINISIDPKHLSVRAVVELSQSAEGLPVRREIIQSKTYFREFHLGEGVDHQKVDAQYEDGVLTLTVSKLDSYKARTISIT